MKTSALLFAWLCIMNVVIAQVPNGSFENWTDGKPDGWGTPNEPGVITPITRVSPGQVGSYAARGEILQFPGVPFLAPAAMGAGPEGEGFAVTIRYAKLTGYYKFSSNGGDKFMIAIGLKKGENDSVGYGAVYLQPASVFTRFECPITYLSGETPDTCLLAITIIGPTNGADYHKGSSYEVDALEVSEGASAVEESTPDFSLHVYPNPMTESGNIVYSIPLELNGIPVSVSLFDALGREVTQVLRNEVQVTGLHSISTSAIGLPIGAYRCEIRVGARRQSVSLSIVR